MRTSNSINKSKCVVRAERILCKAKRGSSIRVRTQDCRSLSLTPRKTLALEENLLSRFSSSSSCGGERWVDAAPFLLMSRAHSHHETRDMARHTRAEFIRIRKAMKRKNPTEAMLKLLRLFRPQQAVFTWLRRLRPQFDLNYQPRLTRSTRRHRNIFHSPKPVWEAGRRGVKNSFCSSFSVYVHPKKSSTCISRSLEALEEFFFPIRNPTIELVSSPRLRLVRVALRSLRIFFSLLVHIESRRSLCLCFIFLNSFAATVAQQSSQWADGFIDVFVLECVKAFHENLIRLFRYFHFLFSPSALSKQKIKERN